MPNRIGAFLKASKCFSQLGINITRVSYNKAVDSHTLFIDAEGTEEQLGKADIELEKIGYLPNSSSRTGVVLIEFCLKDIPGSVTNVLTLINEFEAATGVKIPYTIVGRREGDIEQVWAAPKKANEVLGWKAETPIRDVLASAWKWEKHIRNIK